jgi:hypothetical protein
MARKNYFSLENDAPFKNCEASLSVEMCERVGGVFFRPSERRSAHGCAGVGLMGAWRLTFGFAPDPFRRPGMPHELREKAI